MQKPLDKGAKIPYICTFKRKPIAMTDIQPIPATTIARLRRLGKNNLSLSCA
ncbi:MAG: hypothetical protein IJL57_03750 [Bacteroidales bacterium]|nr:hypothetical protein [Bacteroidales bacterium]